MSVWIPVPSASCVTVGDMMCEYNNYWDSEIFYLVTNIHPSYYDNTYDTTIETCYDLLSINHPDGNDIFHITGMEDFKVLR